MNGYRYRAIFTNSAGSATTNTATLTVNAAPGRTGGGGGGGGERSPTLSVQFTGIVTQGVFSLNSVGQTREKWQLVSTDGSCILDIPSGTYLLDSSEAPLSSLECSRSEAPPIPPAGKIIITAYDFKPDGARFNPEISITLKFDPARLPPDFDWNTLQIGVWNGSIWDIIEGQINTGTPSMTFISGRFYTYAILAGDPAAATPAPLPVLPSTPAPPPTALPVPSSSPASPTPQIALPEPVPTPAPAPSVAISEVTQSPGEMNLGEPSVTPAANRDSPAKTAGSGFPWWGLLIIVFAIAFLTSTVISRVWMVRRKQV
jgi:hypothetical protein